ncbi:MAG: bifunctional oligoribonuclease/PAP phosphatase NrnA [Clostridiales bacterium]|jgi:phosphoesterase RecJ-like protein|nr:bifunctional oligoribonuclease/PAP phosphatase NrnA [Clostridiales bacterium]
MSIFNLDILEQELTGAKKIAITGHIRPDGDCIGSCSALYQYLIECKKELNIEQVDVYLETFGQEYNILSGIDKIRHRFDYDDTYDVMITLDCSSLDRLGHSIRYFETAKRTICIDHHITNDNFADVNHVVADASSTCEVIYDLLVDSRITKEIAKSLYIGIVHDTGIFRHVSTSGKTMEIAASLIRKGIDFTKLIDETFTQKTYAQMQIMGRALMESVLYMDGKLIASSISLDTMKLYEVTHTDLDGIIDQLRTAKGTEVAMFIYETEEGDNKISLRSNGRVNVSEIARSFGGGGHVKAAGCSMEGTAIDAIAKIIPHIEAQLIN